MTFKFSLSAYQEWQRCEAAYNYKYVRDLRPLLRDLAPERGIVLHEYLANYYQGLKDGVDAPFAHRAAVTKMVEKHGPSLQGLSQTAFFAGQEDVALEYQGLLDVLMRICERYYEVRGKGDAAKYEVLLVEKYVTVELIAGVNSNSIIDLVLRERDRGITWLTEHKTTLNVPDSAVRVRDFQTLLYAEVLSRKGMPIDGVIWNYIRTKEPDEPHQNKDGKFSRAKHIDTTWPLFEAAVLNAGQDPEQYADVRERLCDRELTSFFPRYEHVIVARPEMLLRDYMQTAMRVKQTRWEWEIGASQPVRSLQRNCDWCSYFRLCEAAITGGDEDDIIRMKFTQGGKN